MNSYILMKTFEKKEFAQMFMSGSLYCNSLAFFRDNRKYWGKPLSKMEHDTQLDITEGSMVLVNPKVFVIDENVQFKTDVRLKLREFEKCHICSFTRVECMGDVFTVPDMREFGNYAVIIYNPEKFYSKISSALMRTEFDYVAGPVKYRRPTLNGNPIVDSFTSISSELLGLDFSLEDLKKEDYRIEDCFVKRINYEFQKEWRLCIYKRAWNTEPFILKLNDSLDDCCRLCEVSRLPQVLESIKSKVSSPVIYSTDYIGNISRKDLVNKILHEDSSYVPIISI